MEPQYYAKYFKADGNRPERVWINCVLDVWETGFSVDNWLITPDCVYFEDASWSGKKLDYSTLGKRIERKKYEFVRETVFKFRKELEDLGKTGTRMRIQDFKCGHFYFQISEDENDNGNIERYADFFHIVSVIGDDFVYKTSPDCNGTMLAQDGCDDR